MPRRPSVRRVVAKYKDKKEVPKSDGRGTTTVYEYGPRQLAKRHKEKAVRIEALRKKMADLRQKARSELTASDPETRLTALAVCLMDETYERVGNEQSAKSGHHGVTNWTVDHITLSDKAATIKYTGKSGVKHEKKVTNARVLSALRKALKGKGKGDKILCDGEDCSVLAKDVNAYLKPFGITAKDIRGLHANEEMKHHLKAQRKAGPADLPRSRKEKDEILKAEFQAALDLASAAVGHEAATLRSQYLVPSMEASYVHDGTVIDKLDKKASSLDGFLDGFFRRHPTLSKYRRRIRFRDREQGSSSGHGEARQHGDEVWLFPKFWTHQQEVQDFVLAHEIGHWVLSQYRLAEAITQAYAFGIDPWDTLNLPFGQFNMDEAFADSFASYYTDGDVKRRYPEWTQLVEAVISGGRTATLSDSDREDREDEAQVRQSPKLKPPRTDKERRLVKDRDNAEDDPDMKQDQKDRSRNYKDAAARVALRFLLADSEKVPMYNTEAEKIVLVSPETARAESGKYKEPTEDQLQQQGDPGSDDPGSDDPGSDDPGSDTAGPGGLEANESSAADAVVAAREKRKALTSEDEELWDIEDIRGAVGEEFKAIPGLDSSKVDEVISREVIVTPDGVYEPETLKESLFDSVSAQMGGPVDTRKVKALLDSALSVESGDKPDIESIKMAVKKALTEELNLGNDADRIADSIQLTDPRRYVGGLVKEMAALDSKAVKQFDKKVSDARKQVLTSVENLIGSSRQISDLPTSLLMGVAARLEGSEGALADSLLDSTARSKIKSKAEAADKVLEKVSDEKSATPSADEIASALIAKRTQSLADDPTMLNPAQPLSSLSLEPLKVRKGDEGAFRSKMADRSVDAMRLYLDMESGTRSKHREKLESMLTELDGDGHRDTEQYAAAQAQLRGLAVASALEDGGDAKGVNPTMQKALQFARKDGRLDAFVRLNITGAAEGDGSAQSEIRDAIKDVDSEDLKEMLPGDHPGQDFLDALNNETFLSTMDSESQEMLRVLADDMILSEMVFTDMDLVAKGKSVKEMPQSSKPSSTKALLDFFDSLGIPSPARSSKLAATRPLMALSEWDFAPWGTQLPAFTR